MAKLTGVSRTRRMPSYRGKVMIDVLRGQIRVRKWPEKRGPPKSPLQAWWVDWFKQANLLAKYADGASLARAIDMSLGSGMYPRDILLKAMRGRLYSWVDPEGNKWRSMAAINDISNSLDVLSQAIGSVLVRATDRWRVPEGANPGYQLTYVSAAAPPVWQAPAASGVQVGELAESPISPDNTIHEYFFDVAAYSSVEISIENLGNAASDAAHFRFSTDGGATYRNGAADYRALQVSATVENSQSRTTLLFNDGAGSSGNWGIAAFRNLRAGRGVLHGTASKSGSVMVNDGQALFDGPITNIRLFNGGGSNFNAGVIRATGEIAA